MHFPSRTVERFRPDAHLRPVGGLGLPRRPNGHASAQPSSGRTYDELYDEAKRRNIKGRSKMSKTELERALGR
jgi:hypothetical protein